MFIVGVLAAVIGIALFHTALGKTIAANSASRIPFGRRPSVSPHGSVAMRALGAGLIVLGAVFVGTAGWHWTAMVVVAGPLTALAIIGLHNRRVRRGADAQPRR
ncbi:hypothetical protein [Microbacterium sp.]|uniref:hypothetical protein n=1 Tax=Microbacterium sp. TaxID=51671 RepID=UPI00289B3FB6|nr:hypothetical protein [Microbacterium sp.]